MHVTSDCVPRGSCVRSSWLLATGLDGSVVLKSRLKFSTRKVFAVELGELEMLAFHQIAATSGT